MSVIAAVVGLALIASALWDAFETIVLPRRIVRRVRIAALVYRLTWSPWARFARRIKPRRREAFLSYFGPLVVIFLFVVWAVALMAGFALLQWATGSALVVNGGGAPSFTTDLYMSGTTFFTLGLGDVVPHSGVARFITVGEAGTGFGFLALVISYLPVLYQAFSRREVSISLLDARAGSPPAAVELLRRNGCSGDDATLTALLQEWERWASELLESHLSYPSLAYFRSHHENQSWLTALTAIMDTCALLMVGVEGAPVRPARLTFAMARHAIVDLSQVLQAPPRGSYAERLPAAEMEKLRALLTQAGVPLRDGGEADRKLAGLRRQYEPYVAALSHRLLIPLPPWLPPPDAHDDWETSAWE